MTRVTAVLLLLTLLLLACGPDDAPPIEVPPWAKVAPEQIAEAKKHGVPVAFESDLGMRFVLIPAGTFLMGAPEGEERHTHPLGWPEDEHQHEVTLSRPFYMQITEVTNDQYRRHMEDHRSLVTTGRSQLSAGSHYLDGGDQPVTRLSWNAVAAFSSWWRASTRNESTDYRQRRSGSMRL